MKTSERILVNVKTAVKLPVEKVWELWTNPWHIIHWYQASAEWHTSRAENDVKKNGRFSYRMEARDGSAGFDFSGEYRKVTKHKYIECFLDDSRNVKISFIKENDETLISESFEAEETFPAEYQKAGWQSILDSFKRYAEDSKRFAVTHFEIAINKPVENVFNTMLGKRTYQAWTSVFNSASRFEGAWQKGSKILFIGQDENGNTAGIVSRIKDLIKNSSVMIEHQGILKNGEEIINGSEADTWKGAIESYSFKTLNDTTMLSVDLDSLKEFEEYFDRTWPEALRKLKSLCEE